MGSTADGDQPARDGFAQVALWDKLCKAMSNHLLNDADKFLGMLTFTNNWQEVKQAKSFEELEVFVCLFERLKEQFQQFDRSLGISITDVESQVNKRKKQTENDDKTEQEVQKKVFSDNINADFEVEALRRKYEVATILFRFDYSKHTVVASMVEVNLVDWSPPDFTSIFWIGFSVLGCCCWQLQSILAQLVSIDSKVLTKIGCSHFPKPFQFQQRAQCLPQLLCHMA